MKFAIAVNPHGVIYYLNADHIRVMTERGKGADWTTMVEMTDGRSLDVRTSADDIVRQAQSESFIEVNTKGSGIRLFNTAQILSVDLIDDDDGCVITFLSGDKVLVDESYDQMCDMLAVDQP